MRRCLYAACEEAARTRAATAPSPVSVSLTFPLALCASLPIFLSFLKAARLAFAQPASRRGVNPPLLAYLPAAMSQRAFACSVSHFFSPRAFAHLAQLFFSRIPTRPGTPPSFLPAQNSPTGAALPQARQAASATGVERSAGSAPAAAAAAVASASRWTPSPHLRRPVVSHYSSFTLSPPAPCGLCHRSPRTALQP